MGENMILSATVNTDKGVFTTVVSSAVEILPIRPSANIQKNTVLLQQQMRPMERGGCERQSSCLTDSLCTCFCFGH